MEIKSIIPPDGGLNKNLPNHLIPDNSWVDMINIYFGNGFLKKTDGWLKLTTNKMDGTVRNISNYIKYNGDNFLILSTNSKIYRLNDSAVSFVDLTLPPTWRLNTSYSDDSTSANFCIPTVPNNHYYKCTTAGTSGGTEPIWPTTGGTVTDGTAVWTDMGTYLTLNGTLNYPVFMENAQNNIIITNYLDPIHYWNGTNDIIRELPGTNELEGWVGSSNVLKAKCILYSNEFLILGQQLL